VRVEGVCVCAVVKTKRRDKERDRGRFCSNNRPELWGTVQITKKMTTVLVDLYIAVIKTVKKYNAYARIALRRYNNTGATVTRNRRPIN
jgi:hypothetical protein